MGAASGAGSRDLPILLAVASCLGAAWAAHELGVSPALGAFVAGLLLSNSPFAMRVRADVAALRALFVTTFFASIGMLASPSWIAHHFAQVGIAVVVLVAGKALITAAIGLWLRHRVRHAVATAICLAQIGEFAFVLASVAQSGGLISAELSQAMVATAFVSLLVTPWLVAAAPIVGSAAENGVNKLRASLGLRVHADVAAERGAERRSGHAVVIGLGPAGRGTCLDLQRRGLRVVAYDMSHRCVRDAEREGIEARLGDAARDEVLADADISTAQAVVVTIPELRASLDVIGAVRARAPSVPVVARARHHVHALHMVAAGAAAVVDEEWEMGGRLGAVVAALSQGSGDAGAA